MIRYFSKRFLSVWLLVLLPAAHLAAQEDLADSVRENVPVQYGDRPKNADRAKTIYQENLSRYKDADDVLVLPGLIARRNDRRVEILAEATGLTAETTVEFLLIDQSSDRGYEALWWSMAKPGDVHKALVFIGVQPGKPFNPAELRFWSKGERVLLSIASDDDSGADVSPPRLESLVMDKSTGEPLPEVGFVFADSFMVDHPDGKTGRTCAADVYEPRSVASIYNDPIAVLDVPRRARKSAVYGTLVVGREYDFAKNELVTIVLEPEYKDGRRRVKDLVLQVRHSPEKTPEGTAPAGPAETLAAMEFVLGDTAGQAMSEKPQLPAVLAAFGGLINNGHDPYVSVRFDHALCLAEVRTLCRVIGAIDSESGIRVEPPAPGQLYYQAFLPDRELLDRENRIIQPWELRLVRSRDKQEVSGTLTLHESVWDDDRPEPGTKVTTLGVSSPKVLRKQLDADAARRKEAGRRPGPPVLLVFAGADLEYGQLLEFLGPALVTHNTIHVFLESEED